MEKAISSDFVFLKYKEKNHPQNNIYNKLSILSKKEKAKKERERAAYDAEMKQRQAARTKKNKRGKKR